MAIPKNSKVVHLPQQDGLDRTEVVNHFSILLEMLEDSDLDGIMVLGIKNETPFLSFEYFRDMST